MKIKLDISDIAQAAKLLKASSDGVIRVDIPSYGFPKVQMTQFGFKWVFKEAAELGHTSVHHAEITYYYIPDVKA